MAAGTMKWVGATDSDFDGAAANWVSLTTGEAARVPVTGDSVIIPSDATVNLNGGDQSAVLLVNFTVEEGCTITIGSSTTNLHIDADAVVLAGIGRTFLEIDNSTTIDVRKAGSSPGDGQYALNLSGASNAALNIMAEPSDSIGVADWPGETGAFTAITVSNGTVTTGESVTATTITLAGGTTELQSGCTTLNQWRGQLTHTKGAVTTFNGYGGTTVLNATGTIGTSNLYDGHTLDLSKDLRGKTLTTVNVKERRTIIRDPYQVATVTTWVVTEGIG